MSNNAMLAGLNIGLPQLHRHDSVLTSEILTEKVMGEGAGDWSKHLYPSEARKLINTPRNTARAVYYKLTLPYPEIGYSIVPAGMWYDFKAEMGKHQRIWEAAVDKFVSRLDEWIQWAKKAHNGHFDGSLYPTSGQLRERLYWDVVWKPLPSSSQFTEKMREVVGDNIEKIDKEVGKALREADKALWERIMVPLRNLAELPNKERVHDAVLDNVKEIIDLAPKMVIEDPGIAPFCAEIKAALKGVTIEQCKDPKAQKKIASLAKELARTKGVKPQAPKQDARSISDRLVQAGSDYI